MNEVSSSALELHLLERSRRQHPVEVHVELVDRLQGTDAGLTSSERPSRPPRKYTTMGHIGLR